MSEPKVHSSIEDSLPDSHPLAHASIYCKACGVMVHAMNNECMQVWIETGSGAYCAPCFGVLGPDMEDAELELKR
jgi:hypothetical protein